MTCERVDLGDGIVAILCGRPRRPPKSCAFCPADCAFLCDFPVGRGHTCSLPICEKHRYPQARGIDYCPTHAARSPQAVMPGFERT
jgi:hypothetical protein